jgi:hypothetical protein
VLLDLVNVLYGSRLLRLGVGVGQYEYFVDHRGKIIRIDASGGRKANFVVKTEQRTSVESLPHCGRNELRCVQEGRNNGYCLPKTSPYPCLLAALVR